MKKIKGEICQSVTTGFAKKGFVLRGRREGTVETSSNVRRVKRRGKKRGVVRLVRAVEECVQGEREMKLKMKMEIEIKQGSLFFVAPMIKKTYT